MRDKQARTESQDKQMKNAMIVFNELPLEDKQFVFDANKNNLRDSIRVTIEQLSDEIKETDEEICKLKEYYTANFQNK